MAGKRGRKGGRRCKRQRELRESEEWRAGRRKGINDELQFCFFYAHPYVKYPDREIRICCVMCDAENI